MARTRIVVAVVVAVAVVAAYAWYRHQSRDAQIERMHEACLAQFGGAKETSKAAAPKPGETVSAADALGKAMQDLVRGVTAGMSGAACGAVRDACQADFEGIVCRNAIASFH